MPERMRGSVRARLRVRFSVVRAARKSSRVAAKTSMPPGSIVFGGGLAGEEMEGGTAFGAGFGEDEGAVGEVEGGEVVAAAEFRAEGAPVETAGDHEVQDEPEAVVELDGDALADAVEGADGVAFDGFDAGLDGAEQEWAGDADVGERLAYDAWLEGGEIGGDVGEFWHGNLVLAQS